MYSFIFKSGYGSEKYQLVQNWIGFFCYSKHGWVFPCPLFFYARFLEHRIEIGDDGNDKKWKKKKRGIGRFCLQRGDDADAYLCVQALMANLLLSGLLCFVCPHQVWRENNQTPPSENFVLSARCNIFRVSPRYRPPAEQKVSQRPSGNEMLLLETPERDGGKGGVRGGKNTWEDKLL